MPNSKPTCLHRRRPPLFVFGSANWHSEDDEHQLPDLWSKFSSTSSSSPKLCLWKSSTADPSRSLQMPGSTGTRRTIMVMFALQAARGLPMSHGPVRGHPTELPSGFSGKYKPGGSRVCSSWVLIPHLNCIILQDGTRVQCPHSRTSPAVPRERLGEDRKRRPS